jgi:N-glycosylase/DNA lyase
VEQEIDPLKDKTFSKVAEWRRLRTKINFSKIGLQEQLNQLVEIFTKKYGRKVSDFDTLTDKVLHTISLLPQQLRQIDNDVKDYVEEYEDVDTPGSTQLRRLINKASLGRVKEVPKQMDHITEKKRERWYSVMTDLVFDLKEVVTAINELSLNTARSLELLTTPQPKSEPITAIAGGMKAEPKTGLKEALISKTLPDLAYKIIEFLKIGSKKLDETTFKIDKVVNELRMAKEAITESITKSITESRMENKEEGRLNEMRSLAWLHKMNADLDARWSKTRKEVLEIYGDIKKKSIQFKTPEMSSIVTSAKGLVHSVDQLGKVVHDFESTSKSATRMDAERQQTNFNTAITMIDTEKKILQDVSNFVNSQLAENTGINENKVVPFFKAVLAKLKTASAATGRVIQNIQVAPIDIPIGKGPFQVNVRIPLDKLHKTPSYMNQYADPYFNQYSNVLDPHPFYPYSPPSHFSFRTESVLAGTIKDVLNGSDITLSVMDLIEKKKKKGDEEEGVTAKEKKMLSTKKKGKKDTDDDDDEGVSPEEKKMFFTRKRRKKS